MSWDETNSVQKGRTGCVTLMKFIGEKNYLLAGINIVVLVTTALVILEAISAISAFRADEKEIRT